MRSFDKNVAVLCILRDAGVMPDFPDPGHVPDALKYSDAVKEWACVAAAAGAGAGTSGVRALADEQVEQATRYVEGCLASPGPRGHGVDDPVRRVCCRWAC